VCQLADEAFSLFLHRLSFIIIVKPMGCDAELEFGGIGLEWRKCLGNCLGGGNFPGGGVWGQNLQGEKCSDPFAVLQVCL